MSHVNKPPGSFELITTGSFAFTIHVSAVMLRAIILTRKTGAASWKRALMISFACMDAIVPGQMAQGCESSSTCFARMSPSGACISTIHYTRYVDGCARCTSNRRRICTWRLRGERNGGRVGVLRANEFCVKASGICR